jgi:hypothetical protein
MLESERMSSIYKTTSTSLHSADVEDIVLAENANNRWVLRATIVSKTDSPEAGVRITLIHQRKGRNDSWEDIATPGLNELKAGDHAKVAFKSQETAELFRHLTELYALAEQRGVPMGRKDLVVADKRDVLQIPEKRRRYIEQLIQNNYGDELWRELVSTRPDLATKLSLARLQETRRKAVNEFCGHLQACDWSEPDWQGFFVRNTWIFGYGLNYRFLHLLQSQATYGGIDIGGKGMERGDFLAATAAVTRFTVLVEIKRPDTKLLADNEYRNQAWAPSTELAGGVAQVQANCRRWEIEGSRAEANADLITEGIYTLKPRGILVIGNTTEFEYDIPRINCFENYRRSLLLPEVMTFDELCERAKYIIEHNPQQSVA